MGNGTSSATMTSRRNRKPGLISEIRKNGQLFVLLSPSLVFFALFSYIPMAGLYFAFTRFNFADGLWKSPFVGLHNFEYLFNSSILLNITKNTILYNIAFIIFGNLTAIIAAIVLSEVASRRFKKFTQSVMFLPYFVSFVLMAAFVYNIFNYEFGTLNTILKNLGVAPIDMYSVKGAWKYILIFFHVWKQLGYCSVIYMAAILGIDEQIYEAAEIDGAHIFQKIWYVILPQIRTTFFVILMFNLGSIMRGQFDLFWQIVGNNSLLFKATDIIDTYVYRTLTTSFDMGMATAAGLYQSVFGLVLVLTVNTFLRKKSPENALF